MNFQTFKQYLAQMPFGKRLPDALYIYGPSLTNVSPDLENFVNEIAQKADIFPEYNVIKFFLSEFRISFLYYPDFFEIPHPVLKSSVTVNLATGKIRKFNYTKSLNPPILHRKETLLNPDHPKISEFQKLTVDEEKHGLYQNTKIIGFKKNWETLLNQKRLSYKGHCLIKNKGSLQKEPDNKKEQKLQVQRHKTAITRYNLSKPVQTLFENNLVTQDTSFFDYGCGQGDDMRCLGQMGYNVSGWDPAFCPDNEKEKADIVNLGFVLNVIEDPVERTQTLYNAFELVLRPTLFGLESNIIWTPFC